MSLSEGDVLNRADKVNYMGLTKDATTFNRMHGFTDMSKSSNPSEYSRRYVDERTERTDVTGYATEIGYALDQLYGDKTQQVIVDVHDNEEVGVKVPIVTVDFAQANEDGSYVARKRFYSIVPDADGDSTDAYTYSGSFKASGDIVVGTATVSDDEETCTFTASSTTTTESDG